MSGGHAWEAILPARLRSRPRDHRGFPVPYFVTTRDAEGRWDFRVVDGAMVPRVIKERRCWVCGQPLGRFMAFVTGPMCCINRTSAEPPSHRECAEFSARVCPFLTRPRMRRNEKDLREDSGSPGGIMLKRNPGVAGVWITRSFTPFRPPGGGLLIEMGPPEEVVWFAEGRAATRQEVAASIESGLPHLQALAEQDGPEGVRALMTSLAKAMALLPKAAAA